MKLRTQLETLKSIRKPATPPGRILRPKKGGGYNRKDFKRFDNE